MWESRRRENSGTRLPVTGTTVKEVWQDGPQRADAFTSTAVGDLVSWSVDANGHVFPANGGAAEEEYPHVIVDRAGIEWTVREVETPQSWARGDRCLVLNSRECVRRLWRYPTDWRVLDADALLDLGTAD
jgi:hypothetical protein